MGCGEIGRHDGLKIRCLVIGVGVQVPPSQINYNIDRTLNMFIILYKNMIGNFNSRPLK